MAVKKTFNVVTGEPVVVKRVRVQYPRAEVAPGRVLENSYVRVERQTGGAGDPDRQWIAGDDKTDKNNEPRFFTKNKRGLDRQWTALSARFTSDTKFHDVVTELRDAGAKVHSYCAMD